MTATAANNLKVSQDDVEHIAQLSRLTVPASEREKFTEQFNQILNYADILEHIDTTGIQPTAHVLPVSNVPTLLPCTTMASKCRESSNKEALLWNCTDLRLMKLTIN